MSLQTNRFYDFANFRLDLSEKVLLRDGKRVPLTPKGFDTLKILLENAGHLLEKDKLMQTIWQDRFVEESNLTFNIKVLRKTLGDSAAKPQFIETVPRRGYRFVAEVVKSDDEPIEPDEKEQTLLKNDDSAAGLKFRKYSLSTVFFAFLLMSAIGVGWWLMQRRATQTNAPILSAPFDSEKLSTNGKVVHAAVSSDGKSVVYTNGTGGKLSVWLRQLETGNNVEIIPPSGDVYTGLALSPDGNFLYFVRRPPNPEEPNTLYRVSIFGGIPQKIGSDMHGWISLSPDGARISFVRCSGLENENCSLWIADSLDGKNERKIAARPRPFRIADNQFSPDGKKVAFAVGQSENQANEFGLMEVDLESGAERELTPEKFFNIKSLEWLPDASGLLITASRIPNKNFRIWQVSIASGAVEPLTKDSETYSVLSLDDAGKNLISTRVKQNFRLFLSSVENPSNPQILADANRLVFAPDGKIVFSSLMSGNDEIWITNADGSGQRQLTSNAADESAPVASPAGDSIYFSSNRTGAVQIWRMNADGSNQAQITNQTGGFPLAASPDGEWIYYHHGINRTLWRVAAKGGAEQMILDKKKGSFAVSPDGSAVAFSEKQTGENILTIVSLADGKTLETFALPNEKSRLGVIAWINKTNIAYVLTEGENNALWRQPINGEKPQKIADLGAEYVLSLAFAPDEKTFAVVQGNWLHDAVLLKGLR